MKIDILGIHKEETSVACEVTPHDLDIVFEGEAIQGPIRVVYSLSINEDIICVRGNTYTLFQMQCARCLESFVKTGIGEFSLVANRLKKSEVVPDFSQEEDEKEEPLIYIEHDTRSIDISEYVHDAVILSLPLKPLCKENCLGLCSRCGKNLNEGECNCERTTSDHRWQELTQLIPKSRKNQ
jgi:uncharacterized protein